MKIKKNDTVVVISGKYKGTRGKVIEVLVDKDQVRVEGVNLMKRHYKPSQIHPEGGIVEKFGTIHVSNVALIDPSTDKACRVGYKFVEDNDSKKQIKVRVNHKTGEILDK